MNNRLGQNETEWKKQIRMLPNIRNLPPKKRTEVTERVYKTLGFNTTKNKILKDVGYHIDINFSQIGRKVERKEDIGKIANYFEDSDLESQYIERKKEYTDVWTPEQNIKKNVTSTIGRLYDLGYLQRLKSRNKDGIIDANFILCLEEKKQGGEEDQINFAITLSVSDWEDIFYQSTKIAKMKNLDIVPVLEIDKYFCKIFDIEKSYQVMPGLNKFGLKDVWDETIGYSIAIMRNFLKSKKKEEKKQLDFLTLTIFYNSINRLSNEVINTYLVSELEKLDRINSLPKSNKELIEFKNEFNKKYNQYFNVSKIEFIDLFNMNETTFYRRQRENYFPFKKSLYNKKRKGKFLDFYTYYKEVYTKNPFGLFEK